MWVAKELQDLDLAFDLAHHVHLLDLGPVDDFDGHDMARDGMLRTCRQVHRAHEEEGGLEGKERRKARRRERKERKEDWKEEEGDGGRID